LLEVRGTPVFGGEGGRETFESLANVHDGQSLGNADRSYGCAAVGLRKNQTVVFQSEQDQADRLTPNSWESSVSMRR
jgi:hypothetical protein